MHLLHSWQRCGQPFHSQMFKLNGQVLDQKWSDLNMTMKGGQCTHLVFGISTHYHHHTTLTTTAITSGFFDFTAEWYCLICMLLGQAYLLFGDESYLDMFTELYVAAMRHMRLPGAWAEAGWLADVSMDNARLARPWVSSLGAFWPGMQVLAGRLLPVFCLSCRSLQVRFCQCFVFHVAPFG